MTKQAPLHLVHVTLAEQVYDVLSDRISSGEYPPGMMLREMELVRQLGVSRTPIREALMRLNEYGLVTLEGRSAQVRQITPEEVKHIYQVRTALELTAIGLACGRVTAAEFAELDQLTPRDLSKVDEPASSRLDRRLHLLIAERSGNPILQQEIRKLIDLIRLAHKRLGHSRRWLVQEVQEHIAIIEALRSGDRRRCRQALRAHLRSACRNNVRCARAGLNSPPNP